MRRKVYKQEKAEGERMDQTGVDITLGLLGVVMVVVIVFAWEWRRQRRSVEEAGTWPIIDATIESGALEGTAQSRAVLPTFAFSYQISGQYYSGRFGLMPTNTDSQALIDALIGRKLQLRYDPLRPEVWFIAEERIEGCKVEQKLGPHVVGLYPKG
jgi:hypothetical protein